LRIAGFLLLAAGWAIALAAVTLLGPRSATGAFIIAGIAVEILGFVLFAGAHLPARNGGGDA
jgi:hypothetical protein